MSPTPQTLKRFHIYSHQVMSFMHLRKLRVVEKGYFCFVDLLLKYMISYILMTCNWKLVVQCLGFYCCCTTNSQYYNTRCSNLKVTFLSWSCASFVVLKWCVWNLLWHIFAILVAMGNINEQCVEFFSATDQETSVDCQQIQRRFCWTCLGIRLQNLSGGT